MQETKTLPTIGCVHLGLRFPAPGLEPGSTRFRGRGGAVPSIVNLDYTRCTQALAGGQRPPRWDGRGAQRSTDGPHRGRTKPPAVTRALSE